MSLCVDLNADLGEGAGHDEDILEFVSSANIACGFHAGDPTSILQSIRTAHELEVAVGAHPSFPDRENFGRSEMTLPTEELHALVTYPAWRLSRAGALRRHNDESCEGARRSLQYGGARSVARGSHRECRIRLRSSVLILFVPPRVFERAASERGLQIAREVFADRNYMPDGTLVSRSSPDAFVRDPIEAAERVIRMLKEKKGARDRR